MPGEYRSAAPFPLPRFELRDSNFEFSSAHAKRAAEDRRSQDCVRDGFPFDFDPSLLQLEQLVDVEGIFFFTLPGEVLDRQRLFQIGRHGRIVDDVADDRGRQQAQRLEDPRQYVLLGLRRPRQLAQG